MERFLLHSLITHIPIMSHSNTNKIPLSTTVEIINRLEIRGVDSHHYRHHLDEHQGSGGTEQEEEA